MTRLNKVFEDALYDWVSGEIPELTQVIWDKQDVERPALPYATINIMTAENIESPASFRPFDSEADDEFEYIINKQMTVSVNIYADVTGVDSNYLEYMGNLRDSVNYDDVLTQFRTAGIGFLNMADLVDLSELVDTGYEFRCQTDFTFTYATSRVRTITEIQRVSGTGINDEPFDTNNV